MSRKVYSDVKYDTDYVTNSIALDNVTPVEIVTDAGKSNRSSLRIQFQGTADVLVRLSPNSDMSDYILFKSGDTICDDYYQKSYYAVVDSADPITVVTWERFQKAI